IGAFPIIAVERDERRLKIAKLVGATELVLPGTGNLVENVQALTTGGAHACVETTGSIQVLDQAIASLGRLGRCAVVGAPRPGSRSTFDII
ncbi:zinc-binding dehydrogenase, partial [Acinetobacter baumannii]